MRLVFFGTPEFAVPTLDAVARDHDIALVVAQPDKPSGRGMQMHAPPVAQRARELGLPLAQPAKIRDAAFLDQIATLQPDAGVVIAYGRILPAALLAIPRHGFFNVHGSILPRWRGAAPIQRAIEAGDTETGVTIMRVDEELDHGPMLAIERTPINPEDRTPTLANRLAHLGAAAMARVLRDVADGTAVETEQDHAKATHAPKLEKSEGEIRWTDSASSIVNRFRAFDPWPGIAHDGLKLNEIELADGHGDPGTVLQLDQHGVVVAAGDGAIRILTMQRPGKPRAAAADVARGLGWRVGEKIP